ncbi:endoglucanase, putative [Talaromyces stipitatus ATCC 10500]|uniref:Glucanase n=1 Tax=Talaromyces stipitatus (strain ATCC 10500 / CBS 375.48 / QM 6759 / NRRL 1006) TaxID=441959 RepID=B8LZT2_TALSN|nr:endoglucanase, putative [Talaromyces stipitatus ATCC 10500]EED20864.1 endoglucanase, putative [Talaromyces stipitatus ATCC 10500]
MATKVLGFAAIAALFHKVTCQQAPTPDNIASLLTWKCTNSGGCIQQSTSIVVDWVYHWIHTVNGSTSCTTSSGLDSNLCGSEQECYANCEISPATYDSLGIKTSGNALTLNQYVTSNDNAGKNYEMLQLLSQEISFDVDVSNLPCGENGALYLSEMDVTGGRSQYNPAGASYGSGYCDAQCGTGTWFNGSINSGGLGSCCNEMDLWEANSKATALTPHPCSVEGPYGCSGSACGSTGVCDKNGCGFNPYALGDQSYYGQGFIVDTSKPFTVTTQFVTSDNSKTGTLTEIRRSYVQNGKVIANAVASASSGFSGANSITESFCTTMDSEAGTLGGLNTMGEALSRGMVLIFSIWNDAGGYMNWLDSGNSGPCSSTAGIPSTIEANDPGTSVTFSNIKWGDIGSTVSDTGGSGSSSSSLISTKTSSTTTTSATRTATSSGATQTHYGQCGGMYYTGPTVCASPYTCHVQNQYYSQCL